MNNTTARLENLPVSIFSVILGLFGFVVAWQKAEQVLQFDAGLSRVIFAIALVLLSVLAVLYLVKTFRFPGKVRKEFNHPVKINFFPIWAKLLLLGSIITIGYDGKSVSRVLWIVGAGLQLAFTMHIVSAWMHRPHFELHHISPALFIPIVGNIIVPIVGVQHMPKDISWFFFSVGLFFWLIFMVIVFYRVIFHDPLPEKLMPTLFILMAPPAIGFISWVRLTGGVDVFAKLLYHFSLFLFFLLLTQIRYFLRLKFFLSSWAYSFPLAAFTIATIFMYHNTGNVFFRYVGIGALLLLSLLIVLLAIRTLLEVARRNVCVEED